MGQIRSTQRMPDILKAVNRARKISSKMHDGNSDKAPLQVCRLPPLAANRTIWISSSSSLIGLSNLPTGHMPQHKEAKVVPLCLSTWSKGDTVRWHVPTWKKGKRKQLQTYVLHVESYRNSTRFCCCWCWCWCLWFCFYRRWLNHTFLLWWAYRSISAKVCSFN